MINREYKDRLFKAVFGTQERKEYALSLYNALNGSSYDDPQALEIFTIEDSVYMSMKNDLAVIFDASMNLYEHQSSFNPNMPLRGLFYFARLYEKYVEQNDLNIYSPRLQRIPTPKYVVFYNGDTAQPEERTLQLSDSFMQPADLPAVEIRVQMLNINYGHNKALMEACRPLEDYSKFVHYVKISIERGLSREAAIDLAIEQAIGENLLDGYFAAHKAEVKGMILTEYDEEKTKRLLYEEAREEGRQEGRAEGRVEGQETTLRLVAEVLNLSEKDLDDLRNSL